MDGASFALLNNQKGPNAPRHRAERAHAEADYDEETARDNYFNPPGRPPFWARGSN